MSSEAITQNDLREILSRTVGSIPSEFKKLLWTNPSPSTQFSAQTLSIDLTNFDAVEVTFKHYYSGDTPQATVIAEKDINAICAIPTNSNRSLPRRNFKATNTGVTFGSGSGFDDTYTWYAQNDAWAIPQKIYGIKYERVAPPQLDASDYVVEQGANYRKWDSGTMEQWGVEATATSSNHAVSFPKAFISTNYIVVGTNTSGTQANFMTSNTSASSFYVYPSASTKLFWIAIGRWK